VSYPEHYCYFVATVDGVGHAVWISGPAHLKAFINRHSEYLEFSYMWAVGSVCRLKYSDILVQGPEAQVSCMQCLSVMDPTLEMAPAEWYR
jgi:hypothetical protein